MPIVNYMRAMFCHSTKAAYALAESNIKYLNFAQKLTAVKNTAAYFDVQRPDLDSSKALSLRLKLNKYDFLLKNLALIEPDKIKFPESNSFSYLNKLPRLEVVKRNSNSHPYFMAGEAFPQETFITGIKPRAPSL